MDRIVRINVTKNERNVTLNVVNNVIKIIVSQNSSGGGGGGVESVSGVLLNNTDPLNPIVNGLIVGAYSQIKEIAFSGATVTNDGSGKVTITITGGGVTEFIELTDVPASYTGQGSKVVAVKADESGLEFVAGGGGATPTLQEVTDEGNTTTNDVVVQGSFNKSVIGQDVIYTESTDEYRSSLCYYGLVYTDIATSNITNLFFEIPSGIGSYTFPDLVNATENVATREWVTANPATPPDATPTIKGIAKLYTSLGSNTDGAVDQNTVNSALDLKANAPLIDTVSSSALTGVTTEGILKSYLIPANTYTASDILNFANDLYKTGTAGTVTSRLYTNTTASLSGASLLATNTSTAGNRKVPLRRQLVLKGGNIEVLIATQSLPDDNLNSSNVASLIAFNPAVDNYFITTAQNASAGDSTLQNNFKLHY